MKTKNYQLESFKKTKRLLTLLTFFAVSSTMAQNFNFEVITLPSGFRFSEVPPKFGNQQPIILTDNTYFKYTEYIDGELFEPLTVPEGANISFLSVEKTFNDKALIFYAIDGMPGTKVMLRGENSITDITPSIGSISNFSKITSNLFQFTTTEPVYRWFDGAVFQAINIPTGYTEGSSLGSLSNTASYLRLKKPDNSFDIIKVDNGVNSVISTIPNKYNVFGNALEYGFFNAFELKDNNWTFQKHTPTQVSSFAGILMDANYTFVQIHQSNTESLVAYYNSTTCGVLRFDNQNLTYSDITPTEGGEKKGDNSVKVPELVGTANGMPVLKLVGGNTPLYNPLMYLYQGNGSWLFLNNSMEDGSVFNSFVVRMRFKSSNNSAPNDGLVIQAFNTTAFTKNHYLVKNGTILGINSIFELQNSQEIVSEKPGYSLFRNQSGGNTVKIFEFNHSLSGLSAFTELTPAGSQWEDPSFVGQINNDRIIRFYDNVLGQFKFFKWSNNSLSQISINEPVTDHGSAFSKTTNSFILPISTFVGSNSGPIYLLRFDNNGATVTTTISGDFKNYPNYDNFNQDYSFLTQTAPNNDNVIVSLLVTQELNSVPSEINISLNDPNYLLNSITNSISNLGYNVTVPSNTIVNIASSSNLKSHTLTGLNVGVITITAQAMQKGKTFKASPAYSIKVNVTKGTQTLSNMVSSLNLTLGGPNIDLSNIVSNSGNQVVFEVTNSNVLTITNNILRPLAIGVTTVTAFVEETGVYASSIKYLFTVTVVGLPTNIKTIETINKVNIYPNPATENVFIEGTFESNVLQIYNSQGQIVLTKSIDNKSQAISLQSLAKGFYLIKIGNFTSILIKE